MSDLWKHQSELIEKAYQHIAEPTWDKKGYALFWEPGTGKSRAIIETLRREYAKHGAIIPTLILAPCIVLENWKEEWLLYSRVKPDKIIVLYGPTKKRISSLKRAFDRHNRNVIAITNYEGVATSKEFFSALFNWGPNVLVCDESQKIKTHNSKRTKAAIRLADKAQYRYLLTGTPVLNSPMDLFSQFRVLDGGYRFGKNFYIFRSSYFYDKNSGMPKERYFPNWQIRKESYVKLNAKIYSCAMRVRKSECLDLPPLIKKVVHVELSRTQGQLYENMKKDFIAFLDGKACTAQLAITKGLRLLQIVTGYVKFEDGLETSFDKHPRQDALKELLEEIAPYHKTIVWCVFKENYGQVRKICDALKLPFVECHGDIPDKKKFANVDSFNNDDDIRVFIGHPGAGGIGINLIASSYCIYYSRNFSLEQDIQSEARNYRAGSERHESITRVDIVAKNTIDELVLESLRKKEAIGEKILREWKEKL